MGFGDFLKGIVAQVNPFDGGKTYGTYNRKRREEESQQNISQPRQQTTLTVRQPNNPITDIINQRKPTNIGLEPNNQVDVPQKSEYDNQLGTPKPKQSFWNKVRDQFDANTEADQYRRLKGNITKGENKPIVLENPGNIISKTPIVGHAVKATNTLLNQTREIDDTIKQAVAVQTGNTEAYRNASSRLDDIKRGYQKNSGGLFNVGTLYDEEASKRGDFKTGMKDIVAPTATAMLDVYTLGKGNLIDDAIREAGLRKGLRIATPNIVKSSAGNFASGVTDTYSQGGDVKDMLRAGGINAVLGVAPDVALPALAKGVKGNLAKVLRNKPLDVTDVIDELDDAATSTGAETAIQALEPRRIPIREVTDVPITQVVGEDIPINVRDTNQPKPLIQETSRDEVFATPNRLIQQNADGARAEQRFNFNKENQPTRPEIDAFEGVTPRQSERSFNLSDEAVNNSQNKLIDDYAEQLRQLGEGNGTQLVPDGEGGYIRTTNNVRFGDTKGKRMTKAMWREEAERQLRSGKADSAFQREFTDAADPEVQSMLAKGERPSVPQGKPIQVKEVNDIPVVDKTEVPQGLPEQPGTVRVTTQADPQAIKTQAAAEQPPVIPRNSKGERLTPVSQEVEVPRVNSDSTSPIESLEMPTSGDVAPNTTYNRIIADETIPKEVRTSVYNMTHEVHNDGKLIKSANELVNNDTKLAQELFDGRHFANQGKVDSHVHLGNSLIEQYNKVGDTDMAGKVYDELIRSSTQAGQGLRAFQSISKISPQGIVRYAERIADEVGKPLTPELRGKLVEAAKDISKMEPGEMKADAIQNMIQMARQPSVWGRVGDVFKSIMSLPRAIMASGDLSFGGRQGAVLGSRFPKEWATAQAKSAKYAVNEEAFKNGMKELANLTDSNGESLYGVFKSMDLDIPAVFGKSEEVFGRANLAESKAAKKVGVGHVVAGSDRVFSGAAAELRANVAKKIIDDYGGVKGIQNWTKKDLTDLGKVINTATGRGSGKAAGWFEKAAPALSDTLFSARLWKSRLDMLNPLYYAKLSPAARKLALQSSGSFATVVGATLAAAVAAGADVESDPRSSDFGKIRVGNNRYDIMGGLQQNIVLAARQLTGEKKNSTTGEITKLDTGGFGKPTRLSVLGDTLQNKLSPTLALGTTLLEGKDRGGQPIKNPWGEVAKLFIPLGVSGTYDTVKNESQIAGGVSPSTVTKGIAKSSPGFGGVGVQTYGPTSPKEIGANDVLKQLNKDGISTKDKDIEGYVSNGDFDKARRASEYNLQKLEADEATSEKDKQNARNKLRDLDYLEQSTPKESDGIRQAFENGDIDGAIRGEEWAMARANDDGELSKKKRGEYEERINRLKTAKDNNLSVEDVDEYEHTTLSEWRAMADDNPELYQKLWAIDEAMAKSGASFAKGDNKKQKYSAKKSGSGRGRGGSKINKLSADFGRLTGVSSNAPKVREYQTMAESTKILPRIKRIQPNIVHTIRSGRV